MMQIRCLPGQEPEERLNRMRQQRRGAFRLHAILSVVTG